MKRYFLILIVMASMNFMMQAENDAQELDQISELINEQYFGECNKERNRKKLEKDGSCGRVYTSFGFMEYDKDSNVIETELNGRKEEIDENKFLETEKDSIKARIFRAYGPPSSKTNFIVDENTTCYKGMFYKDTAGQGHIDCKTKRLKKPSKKNEVTKKILDTLFGNDVLDSYSVQHYSFSSFEISLRNSPLRMSVYMEDSYVKISTRIGFEKEEFENSIINAQSSSLLNIYLLSEIQRTSALDSVILFDNNTKSLNPRYFKDGSGSVIFETFIPKNQLTEEQLETLKKYMSEEK